MRYLLLIPFLAAATAQVPQRTRPATLAIRGVTLVATTGPRSPSPTTVIVQGDRIAAIGPTDQVTIPAGARIVDGTGRFLMPGLIDMHAHLSKTRASSMGLFVINGVTTVRDMGGDYEELRGWRHEVMAGTRIGPRILMPGPILESAGNIERMRKDPPSERAEPFERVRIGIRTPEEAWTAMARLAAMEIDFVKIRTTQDRPTYLALNEAASAHGLLLIGHAPAFPALVVLEAGQDGIEHGFPRAFETETREERLALWRRFAAAGVPVTPTLVTIEAILASPEQLRAVLDDDAGKVEPRRRYLARYLIRDWREQLSEISPERQQILRKGRELRFNELREMHEAGMDVLAGTDVGVLNVYPGASVHDEMALFVKDLGMTPAEAIDRATRRSARALRLGDSAGTIERGRIADFVLLDADPMLDIANTRRIAGVSLRGQYYDRNGMEKLRAQVLAAPDITVDNWGRK